MARPLPASPVRDRPFLARSPTSSLSRSGGTANRSSQPPALWSGGWLAWKIGPAGLAPSPGGTEPSWAPGTPCTSLASRASTSSSEQLHFCSAALAAMQLICSWRVWALMLARLTSRPRPVLEPLDSCQSSRSGLRLEPSSQRLKTARSASSPCNHRPRRSGGKGWVRRVTSVISASDPQLPVSSRIRS